MRVRFAPSPTGHLHVGNARTALFNWLLARGQGGTFVLRLEDTDEARSTVASAEGILEDLRWLGIDWHEGPDRGGEFGPYRQTERLAVYRAYADRLRDAGHAYYCFCSPADLEAAREVAVREGRTPQYAGTCRSLDPVASRARVDAGEPAALRFRVPAETAVTFTDLVRGPITTDIAMIGDFVLLRQNGLPAYNFAVVVDDVAMRISLVVRGEDHVPNTPRQCLIYRALGETPPQFAHLSLVLGPDHAPLSKRHGASSVAEFRARGHPSGGPAQLSRAARMVTRQRRGDPADRGTRAALPRGGRHQERRGVRPRQARVDEPPLPQGGGAVRGSRRLLVPHLQARGRVVGECAGDARLLAFLTACVPLDCRHGGPAGGCAGTAAARVRDAARRRGARTPRRPRTRQRRTLAAPWWWHSRRN